MDLNSKLVLRRNIDFYDSSRNLKRFYSLNATQTPQKVPKASKGTLRCDVEQMAPSGWCRPWLIWAVMLGETESMADWCLSNPLLGWLLASHTTGRGPGVSVVTAWWRESLPPWTHFSHHRDTCIGRQKGGQSSNLGHMIDINRKGFSAQHYIAIAIK